MFKAFINHIKFTPHRNELEKHIRETLSKLNGPILDIGSKNRRYDYLLKTKPIAVDLVANPGKDVIFGDVQNLPFENDDFGSVICFEVLEYVADVRLAASEMSRVLTPDGTAVLSVPFMTRSHGDKMRYTESFLQEVLGEHFSSVEIKKVGSPYSIILDVLHGMVKQTKFFLFRWLCTILYVPLLIFLPIARVSKDRNYVSGYFIIARK